VEKKSRKPFFHSQNGQNKAFSVAKIMQKARMEVLAFTILTLKM
jgi:hypothetical protein